MLLDASPLRYAKPAIPLAKWQNMGRGPDSLELTTGRETPCHRAREAPPAAALVFPADALPSEEFNPAGWGGGSLMATDETGDGAGVTTQECSGRSHARLPCGPPSPSWEVKLYGLLSLI